MPSEAHVLAKIVDLLEGFDTASQQRMTQYLVSKVGLPSIEDRRANDRDRQQRSRDLSRDMSHAAVTNGADPDIYVATPVVRSVVSKKKKEQVLDQEQLDKAKALLKPEDYEFLSACPDPFRTQWLIDPEWWISLRDGYPKVNAQLQASRYMAWEGARRKRDHRAALRNWIAKADRWREGDDMRKAVRR